MTPKEIAKSLATLDPMDQVALWAKEYRIASREIIRALSERFDKTFASPQEIASVVTTLLKGPVLLHPDAIVGVAGYPTEAIAEDIAYHLYPEAHAVALKVNFKDAQVLPPMILVAKTHEELKKEAEKFLKMMGGSESGRAIANVLEEGVVPKKPNATLPSRFTYMMDESLSETGRVLASFGDANKMTVRSFANHMDALRSDAAILLTKDFFKDKPFTINSLKDAINKNWKKWDGIGSYAMALDFKYPEAERHPGERVYEGYALLVGGTMDAANYALKTYNHAHGKAS